jgi:hypothetical protein
VLSVLGDIDGFEEVNVREEALVLCDERFVEASKVIAGV